MIIIIRFIPSVPELLCMNNVFVPPMFECYPAFPDGCTIFSWVAFAIGGAWVFLMGVG
jgi:hypothetical protein